MTCVCSVYFSVKTERYQVTVKRPGHLYTNIFYRQAWMSMDWSWTVHCCQSWYEHRHQSSKERSCSSVDIRVHPSNNHGRTLIGARRHGPGFLLVDTVLIRIETGIIYVATVHDQIRPCCVDQHLIRECVKGVKNFTLDISNPWISQSLFLVSSRSHQIWDKV
jgi:hypothetical protein